MQSTLADHQTNEPLSLTRVKAWVISHKWAIAAFSLVIGGAAVVRLLTFERYLPFIDSHDEAYMYLLTRAFRGVENQDFIAARLSGYPPLYIWIQSAVQGLFETYSGRPWFLPVDYVHVMRVLAVTAGVLTTALVMAMGWQLAGIVGGVFAGMLWGFAPIVVDNNSLALADPMGYLVCAAAVVMAIRAWQKESLGWLFGCLLAAIGTIYVKYWTVYPVVLWGLVALRLLWIKPKRSVPGLVLQTLFGLGAAAGLLTYLNNSGLSRISPEMTNFTDSGIGNMLDMPRNLNNLLYFPRPIGELLFYGVVILGILAFIYSRSKRWPTVDWRWAGILTLCAVVSIFPISSFIYISSLKYVRHALPVTILLMGLWGMAVAQILWTIRRMTNGRYAVAAVVLIGAVALIPYAVEDANLQREYEKTQIQEVLWKWADANVPVDGLVLMDAVSVIESTWNRPWSGYDGSKPFLWWYETPEQILAADPQEYAERGILFFALSDRDRQGVYQDVDIDSFLDKLTLVKHIPAAPELVGEDIWFYRIIPPNVATDADFGGQIRLVGYDLSAEMIRPGETITFRPYWRAPEQPSTNYSMFIHLYPADEDTVLTQYDGTPSTPNRLTLTWNDPDELLFGPDVNLTLPTDLTLGEYRLAIGLYDFSTGARLTLPDGASYFTIAITIVENAAGVETARLSKSQAH
jgi:hypothetical protein